MKKQEKLEIIRRAISETDICRCYFTYDSNYYYYYPNAVNMPEFPSPILKKGEKYDTTTVYKFLVE